MKTKEEVIAAWCQFADRYSIDSEKWATVAQIERETGLRIDRKSIKLKERRMKYANGDFFPTTHDTRSAFSVAGDALYVALSLNNGANTTMIVYIDEFSPVPDTPETEQKTIFWRKREYAIVDRGDGHPEFKRIWAKGDVVSTKELSALPVGTKLEVTGKGLVIA